MLDAQTLSTVTALERQAYQILTEIEDLTQELSDSFNRRDQVSVRLFLNMRQEQILRLQECKAMLDQQCSHLPEKDGALLRRILSGEVVDCPNGEALLTQVKRNRTILTRTIRADKRLSVRIGGKDSFYAK